MIILGVLVCGLSTSNSIPGVHNNFKIIDVSIYLYDDGKLVYKYKSPYGLDEKILLQHCLDIIKDLTFDDIKVNTSYDIFCGKCRELGVV